MADGGATIDQLIIDITVSAEAAQGKIIALAQALRGAAPQAHEMGKSLSEASRSTSQFNRIMRNMAKDTEEAGKSAKSAKTGFATLMSTISRVAKLMLLRMAIRAIIKGIKEGLEMFVNWDKTLGHGMAGAAAAVENVKAAVNGLKGSFGALAGQIITALEPAIVFLIDLFTDLFNILQQGIAILRGEDTWFKYIGGSANDAASGVNKLKKALFGFDELNVLPSASGGGTGGTGAWGNYSPEAVDTGSFFGTAFGSIRDFFAGIGEFFGSGEIGEKIKEAWDQFATDMSNYWETFKETTLIPIGKWVSGAVDDICYFFTDTIPQVARELWSKAKTFVSDAFGWIGEQIGFAKEWVVSMWNRLPEKWRHPLKTAAEFFKTRLIDPIKILADALGQTFSVLIDYITHPLKWFDAKETERVSSTISGIWSNAFSSIKDAWLGTEKSVNTGLEGLTAETDTKLAILRKEIDENPIMVKFNARVDSKGFALNVENVFNDMQKQLNKTPLYFPTYVSSSETGYNYNRHFNPFKDPTPYGFANGGVPNTGTLFYAGEAGAEVVANMGHSTGVMNISQMQEAVASGNAEVVNAVYAMANLVASAINNKDTNVYLDSAKVGQSVSKWQYNQARRGVTQGAY